MLSGEMKIHDEPKKVTTYYSGGSYENYFDMDGSSWMEKYDEISKKVAEAKEKGFDINVKVKTVIGRQDFIGVVSEFAATIKEAFDYSGKCNVVGVLWKSGLSKTPIFYAADELEIVK